MDIQHVQQSLSDWERLYQDLGLSQFDFSTLAIPEMKPGFDRLIVVRAGFTPNSVCDFMLPWMRVWRYRDLNAVNSNRSTAEHYAVWARDRAEADEELTGMTVEELEAAGVLCMNLAERLLFGLKFFLETKKQLDPACMTWCVGSHDPMGGIPIVGPSVARGYDVGIGICWDRVDRPSGLIRPRAVLVA